MSEKKHRPSKDVQQEYQNLVFKAGNLQYAISQNRKDLEAMNNQLRDLTLEYVSAQEAEKTAPKETNE